MSLAKHARAAKAFFAAKQAWLGAGGEPVPLPQAQSRANVCLTCPKNQPKPLWQFLAVPALAILQRQLAMRGHLGLAVQGEQNLHVCGGCLCVLKTKVHVPLEHVKATTPLGELDVNCWIRSELAVTSR